MRKSPSVLIKREQTADEAAIAEVHAAAFTGDVEKNLVTALRASDAWLPPLSLVAFDDGRVVGHVVCTRAHVARTPVLGLGPLGVLPSHQKRGVGSALMHAVLGAADALGEPVVVLLGHTEYYPRFGFRPASEYGILEHALPSPHPVHIRQCDPRPVRLRAAVQRAVTRPLALVAQQKVSCNAGISVNPSGIGGLPSSSFAMSYTFMATTSWREASSEVKV
jgi:putative acetyltransferase